MISADRVKALDYFFNYDVSARRSTSLIATILGAATLLLGEKVGLTQAHTLYLAVCIATLTFTVRMGTYKAPYLSLSQLKRDRVRLQRLVKEREELLSSRRQLLWQFPLVAVAALLVAFLPRETAAQAVNNRLRKLLRLARGDEALTLAQSAVLSNIPLDPDVMPAFGVLDSNSRFEVAVHSDRVREHGLVRISIFRPDPIAISFPPVVLPKGDFGLTGSTTTRNLSVIGAGPLNTVFRFYPGSPNPGAAFFDLRGPLTSGILLFGIRAMVQNTATERRPFLLYDKQPCAVFVANVVFDRGEQSLDWISWTTVNFQDCLIRCNGGSLDLRYVGFHRCEFQFAESIPQWVRNSFIEAQGESTGVFLRWL